MGTVDDLRIQLANVGATGENWPSNPRGHKDEVLLERKRALIDAPHIKGLNEWVRIVNQARGGEATGESLVPWFDPSGGGAAARILILFDAPGRGSSATRGSSFTSIDNDDATAANMFDLVSEAGLSRESFALANIVPWYLPSGTRTKATRQQDVLDASMYFAGMLSLFDQLYLVITVGEHASRGWEILCSTSERARSIETIKTPHPSDTNLDAHPADRKVIQEAFTMAAKADVARMNEGIVPESDLHYSMDRGMVNIGLKPVDILLLANCINEALTQVSDWEAHARLGGEARRCRFLHRELSLILDTIPPDLLVD